jgi:hypothetical protein
VDYRAEIELMWESYCGVTRTEEDRSKVDISQSLIVNLRSLASKSKVRHHI